MSTIISGLVAFVISDRDAAALDSVVFAHARKLLKGRATIKTNVGLHTKYKSIPNDQVMRKLGIVPPSVELVVQRFMFLKEIVRRPKHHHQFVAALWGQLEAETTTLRHGRLGPTHPWIHQLINDVSQLQDQYGADEVFDAVQHDSTCLVSSSYIASNF